MVKEGEIEKSLADKKEDDYEKSNKEKLEKILADQEKDPVKILDYFVDRLKQSMDLAIDQLLDKTGQMEGAWGPGKLGYIGRAGVPLIAIDMAETQKSLMKNKDGKEKFLETLESYFEKMLDMQSSKNYPDGRNTGRALSDTNILDITYEMYKVLKHLKEKEEE